MAHLSVDLSTTPVDPRPSIRITGHVRPVMEGEGHARRGGALERDHYPRPEPRPGERGAEDLTEAGSARSQGQRARPVPHKQSRSGAEDPADPNPDHNHVPAVTSRP